MIISNPTSKTALSLPLIGGSPVSKPRTRLSKLLFKKKSTRRKAVIASIVAVNTAVLIGVCAMVLLSARENSGVTTPALASSTATTVSNPLDQVSSANIAQTVAQMSNLAETTAVTNSADSENTELAMAPTTSGVAEKPQVVTSTGFASNKDIRTYTAVAGDSVTSIAAKFGVTSDSIRWSNDLTGDAVNAGTQLLIPPVTGIVYTVGAGETAESLAAKFRADRDRIIAFNDAEVNGLKPGMRILIPDGVRTIALSRNAGAATVSVGRGFSGDASYAGNGYIKGYCTWYVKNMRPDLPSNLGNARTWAVRAASMGLSTGSTPQKGAAVVTNTRGEGHVAFVESVNDDGSINVSEMNRPVWNKRTTRTISDTSGFRYIY